MPIPDAILNAPELYDGDQLFYDGFQALDTCRQIGFGKGLIPWTAIFQYCAFHRFDSELAEEFMFIIQMVDVEILNYEAEQAEKKREQGKRNGQRS